MKEKIRALGVDDGHFVPHKPGHVPLVGVLTRAPNYLEGVLIRKISVDGDDATDSILDMLSSRYGRQVRVVMTQGITFGGFNILDLERVYEESGIPVLVVSRKMPDLNSMENALRKHFPDWKRRVALLKKFPIKRVKNGEYEIYIQSVGLEEEEEKILRSFTVRGAIPEPVRMAHLFASALSFGESKGKP